MTEKLVEARFVDSMNKLEAGDLICRTRDGVKEYAVVFEVHAEKQGPTKLSLSKFSGVVSATPWPRPVYYRDGWLVDEGGAILLLSEEWENTDKGGAKDLLAAANSARASLPEKQRRIAALLKDPKRNFTTNARDVLEVMGNVNPTHEEIELLTLALILSSRRIWQ